MQAKAAKVMRFQETDEEKGMRATQARNERLKGKTAAKQFETVWVNVVSGLDLIGLGFSQRAALLGYLGKLDQQSWYDVQKDRRPYRREGSRTELRSVASWEEAREICRELESLCAGCKALRATCPQQRGMGVRR